MKRWGHDHLSLGTDHAGAVVIGVAVALAVVDALCFALGAVLQHRGVRNITASDPHTPLVRRLPLLLRNRTWLLGAAFILLGSGLHVVALALAPITVVQPIGILGVPVAVLITARSQGLRPSAAMITGIALSVGGIVAFVSVSAARADSGQATSGALLLAGALVAGLVAILVVTAKVSTGWRSTLAYTFAGASAFGLVSALTRSIARAVDGRFENLFTIQVVISAGGLTVAMAIGSFLVQQAYTIGAPEVVLSCLTVADPLVAVSLGLGLLGEAHGLSSDAATLLIICGLVAAAGTVVLARHHPGSDVSATSSLTRPAPALTAGSRS